MSSFTIVGYFALTNGRKVDVPKKNSGRTTTFTEYTSCLQCSDDTAADLIIHHYSQTTPLPDLTVAFVVAKASIPANPVEPILLLTLQLFPLPGDPQSEQYDLATPDCLYPLVFAIGHASHFEKPADPSLTKSVLLATNSYIHDENRPTNIRYVSFASRQLALF